jgi:hypothetical protein
MARNSTASENAAQQKRSFWSGLVGWKLSYPGALLVFGLIAIVELWARYAADPDFWLPDPYRILIIYLIGIAVVAGWLPWGWARFNVRLVFGVFPVVAFVALDCWLAFRPAPCTDRKVETTPDDLLLRYHYRPGIATGELDRHGRPLSISSDGLWDEAYPVEKPAGTYRIVILGDSVPNDPSIPFPQRFPKLAEARLREAAGGRPVEVINISCEGHNTTQELRLLERVGLKYHPDLVVLAYVLNDPFIQNGGYRRVGDSFALFRFAGLGLAATGRTTCALYRHLHEGYGYSLVVRESMERLKLLSELHHFEVAVAILPLIEPFDDTDCRFSYDRVTETAQSLGLPVARIADALTGKDHRLYLKPNDPSDVTHPNAQGHSLIADSIVSLVLPKVTSAAE